MSEIISISSTSSDEVDVALAVVSDEEESGSRTLTFPYDSQFPPVDRPLTSLKDLVTWFRDLRKGGVNFLPLRRVAVVTRPTLPPIAGRRMRCPFSSRYPDEGLILEVTEEDNINVLEALWIVLGSEPDNFEDYIKETWRLSRYPNDDDPPEVQDELIALYGHFEDTDDEAYNVEGEDDVNMVDDA